ncbi:MAG: thioredoxin family protein [Desulfovibrionaceae bacterium]|nr:thioredoxin family protein [Desulfovibrionaceae bacterium]
MRRPQHKHTIKYKLFLLALALVWGASAAHGAELQPPSRDIPMSFDWGLYRLPGDNGRAALLAVLNIEPDPGWHTYSHDPGPLGKPLVLRASALPGNEPLAVAYPPGKAVRDEFDPSRTYSAYLGPTPLFIALLPDRAPAGIQARIELLLCSRTKCLPVSRDLAFDPPDQDPSTLPRAEDQPWWPDWLAVQNASQAAGPVEKATPATEDWGFSPRYLAPGLEVTGLGAAILFGLLAGLLLNFMPCVLPVISLKLSTLLSASSGKGRVLRQEIFRAHNLFFALGALTYFLVLAVLLWGTGQAWGELFQRPEAVLFMIAAVFALSLSLFGLYHLPIVDLKFDRGSDRPKTQAFLTGVLATLLATPCSGPFLGGVLGWALIQPPQVVAAVFASIGLGMAFPYLVMAFFPSLVRLFPKPGAWVRHVERAVAFFLMATCLYLLTILPQDLRLPCLAVLWVVGVAAWFWGLAPGLGRAGNLIFRLTAAALVAGALWWALLPRADQGPREKFEPQNLRAALGQKAVLVDFTADWCPTCKFLEQTVLTPARLLKLKEKHGLVLLKVDLTEDSPQGEALLRALGGKSIPLAAIFPRGPESSSPLVLRDLFTPGQLEEALDEILRPQEP